MSRAIILWSLVTSGLWVILTAFAATFIIPSVVEAQVARLVGTGLTIQRDDGLMGVRAEVRDTGGGFLQILGNDGQTLRLQLSTAGAPPAGGVVNPAGASLIVYDPSGLESIRVGYAGLGLTDETLTGPNIQMRDGQRNLRYFVGIDNEGNSVIYLLDAQGNVMWSAP
jgi:hypothetical protein